MFAPQAKRHWPTASLLGSALMHGLVLYILCRPAAPISDVHSQVMFGHYGTATELVYFPREAALPSRSSADHEQRPSKLVLPKNKTPQRKLTVKRSAPETSPADSSEVHEETARAGSPSGLSLTGETSGHNVEPALPFSFADPQIPRSQIPTGLEGNVIVRVTIDKNGNVTEAVLVQGLAAGIDEKVVAAVRNWRFHPATVDGAPVVSQHDVVYHFPV